MIKFHCLFKQESSLFLWCLYFKVLLSVWLFSFFRYNMSLCLILIYNPGIINFLSLDLLLDCLVNTLRPRQDGRHFPDDIFKYIYLNENARISLKKSLKFVPKVQINNIPAFVQIMAWRRPGDKPLSEPMMVSLPTHICVTRPQWVNGKHEWNNHRNVSLNNSYISPTDKVVLVRKSQFSDNAVNAFFAVNSE